MGDNAIQFQRHITWSEGGSGESGVESPSRRGFGGRNAVGGNNFFGRRHCRWCYRLKISKIKEWMKETYFFEVWLIGFSRYDNNIRKSNE
jgi:hypothetical protein